MAFFLGENLIMSRLLPLAPESVAARVYVPLDYITVLLADGQHSIRLPSRTRSSIGRARKASSSVAPAVFAESRSS
jgi:hypothetical protein